MRDDRVAAAVAALEQLVDDSFDTAAERKAVLGALAQSAPPDPRVTEAYSQLLGLGEHAELLLEYAPHFVGHSPAELQMGTQAIYDCATVDQSLVMCALRALCGLPPSRLVVQQVVRLFKVRARDPGCQIHPEMQYTLTCYHLHA